MMIVIEAIYQKGVFWPLEPLDLPEGQRVRLTVEPITNKTERERDAAMQRLLEGLRQSNLRLHCPLPSRDELHERR